MVEFDTIASAMKAHRSEDALLGNRFVTVRSSFIIHTVHLILYQASFIAERPSQYVLFFLS